jgi:hypothetical protein
MAAAGDRDSAYGTVISMAPSHCQSTFVLQLAMLVDLYELEAGSLGVRPEKLPEADRVRLSMMTRPLRRAGLAVVPGSDRRGDPPGQCPALATASMTAR